MVKYPQQLKLVVHRAYGPTWIDLYVGKKKKEKETSQIFEDLKEVAIDLTVPMRINIKPCCLVKGASSRITSKV